VATHQPRTNNAMDPKKDIADVHFRVSVKTAYRVLVGAVALTLTLSAGWLSLKYDVAEARQKFAQVEPRVGRIECLIEQQTQYLIYKKVPTATCL